MLMMMLDGVWQRDGQHPMMFAQLADVFNELPEKGIRSLLLVPLLLLLSFLFMVNIQLMLPFISFSPARAAETPELLQTLDSKVWLW